MVPLIQVNGTLLALCFYCDEISKWKSQKHQKA